MPTVLEVDFISLFKVGVSSPHGFNQEFKHQLMDFNIKLGNCNTDQDLGPVA